MGAPTRKELAELSRWVCKSRRLPTSGLEWWDGGAVWDRLCAGYFEIVSRETARGERLMLLRLREKPDGLSNLERRILLAFVAGLSLKSVALEVGLAQSTTSYHIARALKKLGLEHRLELTVFGG